MLGTGKEPSSSPAALNSFSLFPPPTQKRKSIGKIRGPNPKMKPTMQSKSVSAPRRRRPAPSSLRSRGPGPLVGDVPGAFCHLPFPEDDKSLPKSALGTPPGLGLPRCNRCCPLAPTPGAVLGPFVMETGKSSQAGHGVRAARSHWVGGGTRRLVAKDGVVHPWVLMSPGARPRPTPSHPAGIRGRRRGGRGGGRR